MPYSELILGGCAILQAILLVLPSNTFTHRLMAGISAFGFLFAAAALLLFAKLGGEAQAWFLILEDQPLLRLPRAALFLSGLLLGRSIVFSRELPGGRKQEFLFLLTVIALLCDLLVLSRHALLSCILLISIAWLGIFLSGLAYRGRSEGEAVLKFWVQVSISVAIGFGSVLMLALISGGAQYDLIALQLKTQGLYSPETLLTILALCLPYFLVGGIFPFHFIGIDRDQGIPWATQLILVVMVQGAIFLSVWKMGVEIFGAASTEEISAGMRLLQIAGLAGGFWLALFSLSQENSKRLFSALVGAQWSIVLGAGAMPSALGLTAVAYAFSSIFLWTTLLGFTWSRLQESTEGDSLSHVHGAARTFRIAGLVLLISLAAPLCIPGFAGFPSILNLFASMMQQKSILFLLAEALLLALVGFTCLRVGADLLFRPTSKEIRSMNNFRYGALDLGVVTIVSAALLVLGFFWHRIFLVLMEAAKIFLN